MQPPDISQPAIIVMVACRQDDSRWRQLLLGMEEEGIPYHLHPAPAEDGAPVEPDTRRLAFLAHLAASASPLAVGAAVSADELMVHDPHLPAERPLFVLKDYGRLPAQEIRRLGANAARLVKGLPFK